MMVESKSNIEDQFEFELSFYESLDLKNPHDGRVMEILAQVYTRVGRIAEGLAVDIRLCKLRPKDPMAHYNLACSLSLTGSFNEAVEMLRNAIRLGYRDYRWMAEDEDLDGIRLLPAYLELMDEINS